MLFTVVESRDARVVAESEDRKVQMVVSGDGANTGLPVGYTFGLVPEGEYRILRHLPQAAIVTTDLSDDSFVTDELPGEVVERSDEGGELVDNEDPGSQP